MVPCFQSDDIMNDNYMDLQKCQKFQKWNMLLIFQKVSLSQVIKLLNDAKIVMRMLAMHEIVPFSDLLIRHFWHIEESYVLVCDMYHMYTVLSRVTFCDVLSTYWKFLLLIGKDG